ncbi:twin-arginine translocation pathway signal [Ruegeria sp. R11]|nr:twin-arginine translocation pathway signal [Ruegeria sp. R11]
MISIVSAQPMWRAMRAAAIAAAALSPSAGITGGTTPSPDGASVYFVSPKDGDIVSSPVTVVFGLRGMGVAPAGTEKENTGHHHLLIDRPPLGE